MSRTLKWILGIVGVLVILAIIAVGVLAWQNRAQLMANVRPYAAQPRLQGAPNQQPFQFGQRGFNDDGRGPMMRGFRGPMMGGRGRFGGIFGMGLFFLGGIFRLLIPLVLLGLVAILFYQLGKRSSTRPVHQETVSTPPPANPPNNA